MSQALGSALGPRLAGAAGGALMMLFVGLSFDLSFGWLLLAAAIGAAAGAVLVLKGADTHRPR